MVLAQVGCRPVDRVTERTLEEVRTRTGSWGRHAPPQPSDAWFLEGLTPEAPPSDSDDDGMPDQWEKAHGLDPTDPIDATRIVPDGASSGNRHRGYTYIEFYVNELADTLVGP